MNSSRNTPDDLEEIVKQNVYVLAATETKIQLFFPSIQFLLERCHSPYRLDISHKIGWLLVYVTVTIPSRQLFLTEVPIQNTRLTFELNVRKGKWLTTSMNNIDILVPFGFAFPILRIFDKDT